MAPLAAAAAESAIVAVRVRTERAEFELVWDLGLRSWEDGPCVHWLFRALVVDVSRLWIIKGP